MTQVPVTTSPADALVISPHVVSGKSISVQEIAETFAFVEEDIEQIGKLLSEEKVLVAKFFESLRYLAPMFSSISVSTSVLPFKLKEASQAYIDLTGHLTLTFEGGRREVWELNESENRDLLMIVVEDIIPKLNSLMVQNQHKVETPKEIQAIAEIPKLQAPVAPEPLLVISVEIPVNLPESIVTEEIEEEIPQESPSAH